MDASCSGGLSLQPENFPAEADLNNVVHMKADSPEVHYALAKLHQARGAAPRQRQELTETLRLNPLLLQARIEIGWVADQR